jgi:hypothetical protein
MKHPIRSRALIAHLEREYLLVRREEREDNNE